MRTITETFEVFKLNELSAKSQETAYERWLNNFEYFWADENRSTLDEFCKLFDVRVYDWEYGCNYNYRFDITNEDAEELCGLRLWKFLMNNFWNFLYERKVFSTGNKKRKSKILYEKNSCFLTGYCMDDTILSPVYDFLEKPCELNYRELIDSCLDNFFSACNQDYEYEISRENFETECSENGWEFFSNGKLYN